MPETSAAPRAPLGHVVTFYSYKGGTGRSMMLENVAWILASSGYRVLTIDWDLEAPGLHRYFRPYLRDAKLVSSDGLIDFFVAFADAARAIPEDEAVENSAAEQPWFCRHADLQMFASALDYEFPTPGRIDFVPAGRQDTGYSLRVNSFNWYNFYTKLGGGIFLEEVKRQLRETYDYVLIDSRTGVSDTSGLCTVQMPDTLVVCYTLNEQSIDGASSAALSARSQRGLPSGEGAGLRVVPVVTRVDSGEKERIEAARRDARGRFSQFLDWLDEDQVTEYWGQTEVPYVPFYSLEEVLAVFGDSSAYSGSMLSAMTNVTSWITKKSTLRFRELHESVRLRECAKFLRSSASSAPHVLGVPTYFVSYSRLDYDDTLTQFLQQIESETTSRIGMHVTLLFDATSIQIGQAWETALREALEGSVAFICLLSPAYLKSEYCLRELAWATSSGKPIIPIEWVKVQERPPLLEQLLWYSSSGGLRGLYKRRQTTQAYSIVAELAAALASVATESEPADRGYAVDKTLEVLLVVLAERAGEGDASERPNLGVRRDDWVPFPGQSLLSARQLLKLPPEIDHVEKSSMPLTDFWKWFAGEDREPGQRAIVLSDPWMLSQRSTRTRFRRAPRDTPVTFIVCVDPDDPEWGADEGSLSMLDDLPDAVVARSPDEVASQIQKACADFFAPVRNSARVTTAS